MGTSVRNNGTTLGLPAPAAKLGRKKKAESVPDLNALRAARAKGGEPTGASMLGIEIPPMEISTMIVRVIGDSPLLCHKWSEKAKRQMKHKQEKGVQAPREARDPKADYEASLYKMPEGGYGFPALAFKAAAVDACSYVAGLTKVEARGAFHINLGQELVKIHGEPRMHEAMVRVGMGAADIRYRGEFPKWHADLEVRFSRNVLSEQQIVALLNRAGFSVGVGEHRPQRDGQCGMFHVETSADRAGALK